MESLHCADGPPLGVQRGEGGATGGGLCFCLIKLATGGAVKVRVLQSPPQHRPDPHHHTVPAVGLPLYHGHSVTIALDWDVEGSTPPCF